MGDGGKPEDIYSMKTPGKCGIGCPHNEKTKPKAKTNKKTLKWAAK